MLSLAVREPQTLAEMHAAHLARQRRMSAAPAFADFENLCSSESIKQTYFDLAIALRMLALSWRMRAASSAAARNRCAHLIWRSAVAQAAPVMPGHKIIAEVARKHAIPVADLVGPSRLHEHCAARQEAMWRLHRELRMSKSYIGRLIGGRDHTTVIHGIAAHEARMAARQ